MDWDVWQSETGDWHWFARVGRERFGGIEDTRPAAELRVDALITRPSRTRTEPRRVSV